MVDSYVDANMAMDIPVLLYRPGQNYYWKQTYVSGGKTLTRSSVDLLRLRMITILW